VFTWDQGITLPPKRQCTKKRMRDADKSTKDHEEGFSDGEKVDEQALTDQVAAEGWEKQASVAPTAALFPAASGPRAQEIAMNDEDGAAKFGIFENLDSGTEGLCRRCTQ
jgi:hypothetical protein